MAQLVSAPPCHGGGRGFKSRRGRSGRVSSDDYSSEDAVIAYLKVNTQGSVAQLVERLPYKQNVGGSTPSSPTKFPFIVFDSGCAVVAQLVRVPACHAGGRGFEPRPPRHYLKSTDYISAFLFVLKTQLSCENRNR